jgi:hypothetical protein
MPSVTFDDLELRRFVLERGSVLHVLLRDFMEG